MANNATIGALKVMLGLDSAQFSEGLKKSKGGLDAFAKNAATAGAAIGAALAGVALAMSGAIKGAIDNADELGKTAQKVGVAVEELSRLKYAAELSDVSLEGLSNGLKRLSANMAEVAATGKGKAANAFNALGISVTDASGNLKSGGTIVSEVAGKFAGMADGAGKTAIAMAIFGKSGADLIPLLNSGADGLKAMADEADALGVTIDTKTAKAAEQFNDNLTRLGAVKDGIVTQITARMLPALASMSDVMVQAASNTTLMDQVASILTGTIKGLVTAGVVVGAVFKTLAHIIGGTVGALIKVTQGDFAGAQKAMRENGQGMVDTLTGSVGAIKGIWAQAGADTLASAPAVGAGIAAPMMQAADRIKAASDKAAKDAAAARAKVAAAAAAVIAGLMTADEKYEAEYLEHMAALNAARRADVISLDQYLDAVERLNAERAGRTIKALDVLKDPELVRTPKDLAEAWTKAPGQVPTAAQQRAEAFDRVGWSVGNVLHALKNGDWAGAGRGLGNAISSLKTAFGAGGTTAGRIGAAAGVADAAGQMIGGTAGSALGGAAGGAMAGFTVAGPVGAAVGAVLGGIAGFLGGSKAKKQQKAAEAKARADEAARKAAEEAARLLAIANEKRSLEITLMELQGDAAGALAARRQDELAAMDDANDGLAKQIYALQDAAIAAAKAADLAARKRELEIRLMEAQGDELGVLAARRADELAAMDDSLDGLLAQIHAAEDLAVAQEAAAEAAEIARAAAEEALATEQDAAAEAVELAEGALAQAHKLKAAALQTTIDSFRDLERELRTFSRSLDAEISDGVGGSLAQLGAQFAQVARRARLGDADAGRSLIDVGGKFAEASKSQARTLADHLRNLAGIKAEVSAAEAVAGRQASIAEQQLDQLNATVNSILKVDESVLSVRDAIAALDTALMEQISVQTAAMGQMADLAAATRAADPAPALAAMAEQLAAMARDQKTTASVLRNVTRDGNALLTEAA